MAGARTRTLTVGAKRFERFAERGRWIEVIDGGAYGFRNKLTVQGPAGDNAVSGEHDVPCVAGALVVADFDEVTLELPYATGDTVILRMGDGPVPVPVTGKPRVKWISSGENLFEGIGSVKIIDFSGSQRADDDTRERHELLELCGWIIAEQPFTVIATVSVPWNARELIVAKYAVQQNTAPAGNANASQGFCCELYEAVAGITQPARFPPNLYNLQAVNSNGALSFDIKWIVGVRG